MPKHCAHGEGVGVGDGGCWEGLCGRPGRAPSSAWAEVQPTRKREPSQVDSAQTQGVEAVASARVSGPERASCEVSRAGAGEGSEEGLGPRSSGSQGGTQTPGFCCLGFRPPCGLGHLQSHFFSFHFGVHQAPSLAFSFPVYFHLLLFSTRTTALNMLCVHTCPKFLSPVWASHPELRTHPTV